MFGRWLALMRRGPELLRHTSLDVNVMEPVECEAPPEGTDGLSSRDAGAHLRDCELGEGRAPVSYKP
jgi:hypothetical protein